METYLKLKGLIYLVIIAGTVIFITIIFSRKNNDIENIKNYYKLKDSLNVINNEIYRKINFLEFENTSLQSMIKELESRKENIKSNNSNYKKDYGKLSNSETDKLYLDLFK